MAKYLAGDSAKAITGQFIEVDDELNEESGNLITNSAIAEVISTLQNRISVLESTSMPINSFYTQYTRSNGEFNSEDEPSAIFGGTWSEVFNDGSFFRVSGGDSENKTREAGIADTMTGRINGVQKDAIRNITGTVNPLVNDAAVMGMTGYNGAITSNTPSTSTRRADYSGSASAYAGGITFNASSVVPTASENRPVNRLIKVWQRTA